MTYNVFGGTLSLTQSINHSCRSTSWVPQVCWQLSIEYMYFTWMSFFWTIARHSESFWDVCC